MKKEMKKLERIKDNLFEQLTTEQIRQVTGGSISVTECGTALDFTRD